MSGPSGTGAARSLPRERKTTMLRRLFESPETTMMPFGALAIHAQMAEKAGYEAFQLSGAMAAWSVNGMPDAGLLTQTEVVSYAGIVARSVDIPVYSDADTGYGNAVAAWRTTQEFIHAGVAGIHLEDQADPKRAGGSGGVRLASDELAIGRIRAAVEARNQLDPDFVVVARTDAYGAVGGSLAEAIRRGNLYKREGGADVIFYEGIATWDEVRTVLAETPGPAYAQASKNARPTPTLAEQTEMGQAISALRFTIPAIQETWDLLLAAKEAGDFSPVDRYLDQVERYRGTDNWVGHGEVFAKPSMSEIARREKEFLPEDSRPDYSTGPESY